MESSSSLLFFSTTALFMLLFHCSLVHFSASGRLSSEMIVQHSEISPGSLISGILLSPKLSYHVTDAEDENKNKKGAFL